MALLSTLFRGDAQLEAAGASDSAHITPGSRGPHVAKIQTALNRLDGAALEADGKFGPGTASAVLAYKRKRDIVNRSYQQAADNIVGRMTIAALDRELMAGESQGPLEVIVIGGNPGAKRVPRRQPVLSPLIEPGDRALAKSSSGLVKDGAPNLMLPTSFTRHAPGTIATVRCQQTAGFAAAVCVNLPDPANEPAKGVKQRVAFLSDLAQVSSGGTGLPVEDGGRVALSNEPHLMRLECLHPGDAMISVSRAGMRRTLFVDVRQGRKGPVPGAPLTKLTAGSAFFSASHLEGGEGTDPASVFFGRPVNPKRGGRLINLSGEGETPEFEDYQVDLDHSAGANGGFRPWTDDPDRSVFIPGRSASHITMRNTPVTSVTTRVIKRIAQPGCRLTFFGDLQFESIITSQIPGRQLERIVDRKSNFHFVWEIA